MLKKHERLSGRTALLEKVLSARSPMLDSANRTSDRVLDWVLRNPTVTLTLSGLVFFAVLSHTYRRFYASFGVTLNEVGLGYTEILLQSPTFLIITAILSLYLVAAVLAIDVVIECSLDALTQLSYRLKMLRGRYAYQGRLRSLEYVRFAFRRTFANSVLVMAYAAVLCFVASFTAGRIAEHVREQVKRGSDVGPADSFGLFTTGIRRVAVADGQDRRTSLIGRDCLMYLGESAGTTVLYDCHANEAIRIPSTGLILTFRAH